MRTKKCRLCGEAFQGGEYQRVCPACLKEQKATTIRQRICRQCGATFPGGPRAWYCPSCRKDREREAAARYRRNGSSRKLGSTDRCSVCGKEYIVNSGMQKYCPDCAADAVREVNRKASKAWNLANADRMKELKAQNIRLCSICGLVLPKGTNRATCSPECAMELRRQNRFRGDAKRSPRKR